MVKHPRPAHSYVVLMIDSRPPQRSVSLSRRTGHEQIPLCLGCVAVHGNLPVQAVMDGEGEDASCPPKEAADRFPPLESPQAQAFPDCVLGEKAAIPSASYWASHRAAYRAFKLRIASASSSACNRRSSRSNRTRSSPPSHAAISPLHWPLRFCAGPGGQVSGRPRSALSCNTALSLVHLHRTCCIDRRSERTRLEQRTKRQDGTGDAPY